MVLPLARDDGNPALRLVPAARRSARIDYDRLVWRWENSLSLFRRAVESYNTVLSIRARLGQLPSDIPQTTTVIEVRDSAAPPVVSSGPLSGLTRRELEVANLIAQGLTNRQIADALVITHGTAANHVAHVLEKLNATNRTQVAVIVQMSSPPHKAVSTD
jgi:non-specific serine/threonine protein kinase